MSSPESEALRCFSADLVTAISAADPLGLALKLFSKNLVERSTVEDVCLPTNPPTTKSCIIVTAVDRKVEDDPSLFHQFTALLQDCEGDSLKAISKRLKEKYRSILEKELGPSTLPPHHTPHQPSPPQPHSPLRLYADKLRTIYAQSELPKYSNPACYKWTPSPSKKYIDLSTIDRKGMTTKQMDECKKAVLYSQINNITEKGSTNTVKLEEILQAKPGEKLKCILVEGPPGIGKSTLAWQVCHHWGKRGLFQQYSAVLLLPLRDQRVQGATCVKHLFICVDEDLQERVRKEVSQNWDGKDTFIILEGLDELPSHLLSQPSIFTALLSGEALSQATILITSRPSATEQLHKHWKQRISRHFEICGFTEENVDKYAQSVLSNDEQLSGFKKYVSIHPHIQSMLYVPLHCVIAVTVYLQCQQSRTPPPRTLTGLYTCLTQTILTQYLNDHPQYTGGGYTLDTVFNLHVPRPVRNYFKELCRIAFEHVNDQQLVFSDMRKELHDLGFTDAVPELLLYQQLADYSYNFLHLSVQEFLAAYYVSLMSSSEQEQLLKTECRQWSHFENMFRFVAGITKYKGLNKVLVKQAIDIHENTSEQSGSFDDYSLGLLYECQDMSILNTEYTYDVELLRPSPHLCLALGYCIANSSCGWKLKLYWLSKATQADMILQGLKESKACHTSYSIKIVECVECSPDFTHKLFIQHIPERFITSIESLDIKHSLVYSAELLPPCLPKLIPIMERLNTLTLENVFDTSLIPALSRVPTLRNLMLQFDSGKLEMLFPTDSLIPTGTINGNCSPKLIGMFLSQLPQQTIAHIGSFTVNFSYAHEGSQPLPPCLPELIPRMERLNTLTLKNVLDTSLIPALSRVPTLRNLRLQFDSAGKLEMLFPTDSLLPTGTINAYCTPKLISMFLPQLPQQIIAHLGSLKATFLYAQEGPQPLPPCLPELIPRMKRLNTLTLKNVLDTSLLPALSRVLNLPTCKLEKLILHVKIEAHKMSILFCNNTSMEASECQCSMTEVITQILFHSAAHVKALIICSELDDFGHPQPLPPCLPELIPRMERLSTLILENVLDTSLTELIPALSRVPTLRNLRIQSDSGRIEMLFPTDLPTGNTPTLTDMFLPQLPRQTIAHIGSLTTTGSYSQDGRQPLPPFLPELVPRMILHEKSEAHKIPIHFCYNSMEAIECQCCTAEFINQVLLLVPQHSIAHVKTLTIYSEFDDPQLLPPCLPELIPRMERLNTLTLKSVLDASLAELIPALYRVPTLRNLTLLNLNSKGVVLLCQWLPTCRLKTLTLSPDDTEMVSSALTTVSSLKTLDIQRSKFTLQSMQVFVSMLQQNQSLTEVKISKCRINSDSACCLAEALHHNTTLKKLYMSGNPIGERGALAMAEMLKHNTTLEKLNLTEKYYSDPSISDNGIKALVESLAVNQHLKKLTITHSHEKLVESLPVYHDNKERVEFGY